MASGSGDHSGSWAKHLLHSSLAKVDAKLERFSKHNKTAGDLSSDAKDYNNMSEGSTSSISHHNYHHRDHQNSKLQHETSVNSLLARAMSEMTTDFKVSVNDRYSAVHKLAMAVMNKPKEAKSAMEALGAYLEVRQDTVKQLQALRVLDNLFTICGEDSKFREALALRCGQDFVRIVKSKTLEQVRENFLILLDTWQEASNGGDGRFPQFFRACKDLQNAGIKFPARADIMDAQFNPIADNPAPTIRKSSTDLPENFISTLADVFLPNDQKISISNHREQRRPYTFCQLYVAPPQDYLEFALKSLEDAKRTASRFCIYQQQCLHILDALTNVGKEAKAEVDLSSHEDKDSPCHRICKKKCIEILREVKTLVDECCDVHNYGWLQAAVILGDVTEHLWLLLKKFEFYTTLLIRNTHVWELLANRIMDETDSFGEPDSWMITKAEADREALLEKAEDVLSSGHSSIQEIQLARYLAGRLGGNLQLLRVDYKELKRWPEQLGGGASAYVYKTSWLERTFAEKVFQLGGQQNLPSFEHEMSSWAGLYHPNVAPMHCYAIGDRECSLVLELMEMDLSGYMILERSYTKTRSQGMSPFNLCEALDIMIQVAEGMCYLRRKNIVHRDLKPKNILVTRVKAESGEERQGVHVKIADLGLSVVKELSTTYHITMNRGTSVWMAPELIEFNNHNEDRVRTPDSAKSLKYPYACDVYSFGMVCYEVLTGHEPFSSHPGGRVELKHKIKEKQLRPEIPKGYPKALTSLIQKCWNSDPTQRPKIGDICKELKLQMCLLVTGQLNMGD